MLSEEDDDDIRSIIRFQGSWYIILAGGWSASISFSLQSLKDHYFSWFLGFWCSFPHHFINILVIGCSLLSYAGNRISNKPSRSSRTLCLRVRFLRILDSFYPKCIDFWYGLILSDPGSCILPVSYALGILHAAACFPVPYFCLAFSSPLPLHTFASLFLWLSWSKTIFEGIAQK